MLLLGLKVCSFQSVQIDRPPAITPSQPGRQALAVSVKTSVQWIYWLDLVFSSPFLYFFFLHTVYYVAELMNLICWHIALSVSLNTCLTFLSTVLFFLATALPGPPADACALGAPNSAGCGWRGWIRETSSCLQDSFLPCCLCLTSPSNGPPPSAWLCNW